MCGIVGYTGKREAYPVIIKGLRRLENRGYDSAGVALVNENGVNVYKKKGKVAALEDTLVGVNMHSHIGIGHTRWATRGEPSDRNAVSPTLSDDVLVLPAADEILAPMLNVIPLQLLAYHICVAKGYDVDKPRNLAKSETVE